MWFLWFPMFGTWWWALSIVAFIIIVSFVENDIPEGAFGFLLAYAFILLFLGDVGWALKWVGDHPYKTFMGLFAYFTLGLPWVSFWWWWKQSEKREVYNDARRTFVKDHNLADAGQDPLLVKIPDELLIAWRDCYVGGSAGHPKGLRDFWKEHSRSLTCALTWWPLHAACFFFKDFLWNFWKRVLNMFRFLFDRIDNMAWGDVEEDFRDIPQEILDAENERRRSGNRRFNV
jgi:hypothetical protein